ncbi:hypothetical protein C0993_010167 [Termitomyces sp. T159_Od127]|nr:hypothetical protein C0993_010167 [Termitomyces sp. T159_Od127]
MLPVCPLQPPLAPGVFHPVPAANRVAQADVTPAQFARVVGHPQGPPMLAWCRQHGPCLFCARRGTVCEFEAPVAGACRDSSICLSCWSKHKRCLVLWLWWASCVAAEQEWAVEWVQGQMEGWSMSRAVMAASREGGSRPREAEAEEGPSGSEEESSKSKQEEPGLSTVIRVGPLHGKQRPSEVARGKWRASPPPEAGPSKRLWGNASMAGPPGIHVFLPTSARPQAASHETMEQSLLASTMELRWQLQEVYVQSRRQQDELATMAMDQNRVWWDRDVVLAAVRERESELGALRAQVAELESRVAREMLGEGHAVVAAQMAEQEAVCRRD